MSGMVKTKAQLQWLEEIPEGGKVKTETSYNFAKFGAGTSGDYSKRSKKTLLNMEVRKEDIIMGSEENKQIWSFYDAAGMVIVE